MKAHVEGAEVLPVWVELVDRGTPEAHRYEYLGAGRKGSLHTRHRRREGEGRYPMGGTMK